MGECKKMEKVLWKVHYYWYGGNLYV